MIQIVAAGRFAEIIEARHQREMPVELPDVIGISAGDGAEFALPDQSVAEIGIERQIVGAEEARKLQFARRREMPDVVQRDLAGVGLIALARVDGVVKVGNVDRHQARNLRLAVVADEQQRELMRAQIPALQRVDFVLLAMFQRIEETVAVGRLHRRATSSRRSNRRRDSPPVSVAKGSRLGRIA